MLLHLNNFFWVHIFLAALQRARNQLDFRLNFFVFDRVTIDQPILPLRSSLLNLAIFLNLIQLT